MKKLNLLFFAFVIGTLSSCQVVGGILKIGFAGGIIAALVVIFIIIWVISLFRSRN